MTPLALAVDVLAARRVVRLVVEDEITRPLRERVGDMSPALEYLVSCQACSSVWAAGAVTVLPRRLRLVLAVSELAILAGLATNGLERRYAL